MYLGVWQECFFNEFIKAYIRPFLQPVAFIEKFTLDDGRRPLSLLLSPRALNDTLHALAINRNVTEPTAPPFVN
jgi:hypothetical protein